MSEPLEIKINLDHMGNGSFQLGGVEVASYVRNFQLLGGAREMTAVGIELINTRVEYDGPAVLLPLVNAPDGSAAKLVSGLNWKEIEQEAMENLGFNDSTIDAIRESILRRLSHERSGA